ncbi:hypothetical protein G6F56_005418 [Rhizopus delemar]|nr:hypothetical protein G6F56_005418 [Rhizopus delemar]
MTADTQFFTISTVQRDFICVDLSDFEKRRHEVVKTLMEAATTQGFFYVVNHEIPIQDIRDMFEANRRFF